MNDYLSKIKKKLEEVHDQIKKRVDIKSSRTKTWYDQKAKQIQFEIDQKIWLYNPRRMKGKAPKLQSSREEYFVAQAARW